MDFHLSIQAVAQRTGLSQHVIRVWEKRYGAVEPRRTGTNRRVYSEEQVERLALLRAVTQAGQSISFVAKLPIERLRELAAHAPPLQPAKSTEAVRPSSGLRLRNDPAVLLEDCLAAVRSLDATQLEAALRQAELTLGNQGMLRKVAAPLAQAIGQFWRDGEITAAHEHFCSAVLRTWLARAAHSSATSDRAPLLVVTTPVGQLHELGALLAAALAANLGWRVKYLGPNLPAAEIAIVARAQRARAVALSLVYPEDDTGLPSEFAYLRELLPAETQLIVGGRAMRSYSEACKRVNAKVADDLLELADILDGLRRPSAVND